MLFDFLKHVNSVLRGLLAVTINIHKTNPTFLKQVSQHEVEILLYHILVWDRYDLWIQSIESVDCFANWTRYMVDTLADFKLIKRFLH